MNAQAANGAAPVGGPVSGESHGEALLANEHLMAGHGPADVDIDTDPDITEAADLAIKKVPSVIGEFNYVELQEREFAT